MSHYLVNPSQITVTTAPAAEPVTLAQMKTHLRIDHSDDDTYIPALITAAREYIEKETGRAMVERTYRADLPYFYDDIRLPFPPFQSVVSVKYYNTASPMVLTTLSDTTSSPLVTSQVYRTFDSKGRILRAEGQSWPSTAYRHDAVQITFKAGYAPTGSPQDYTAPIEETMRVLVMMTAADFYENREARGIGQGFTPYQNKAVETLLNRMRDIR